MKRKRNSATLIFAGVIFALAAYSFYDFKQSKKDTLGENELKVVTAPTDDFSEVTITSKTQTIQIKKDGGVWKLLQPVADETEETGVTALLNSLSAARVQKIMEDDHHGPISWDKYGLAPGVTVEITTKNGKKDSFSVSDSSAFDGSFYVRKNDQLYLGDRTWAHIADKQVAMLRNHRIWRADGAVTEIHYHYDYGGKVENAVFTKDADGGWKVSPAYDLPVSADKVMSWFDEFKDLRALDFAAPSLKAGDEKTFLLTKPSVKIDLKIKKDDKESALTWRIGQDRDNDVFVVAGGRDDVFRVSKFSLRNVRIPVERLLDTTGILKFPVEEAREVTLVQNGQAVHFIKDDKEWKMEPPPKGGTFKGDQLADFFQKLQGLEPISDLLPSGMTFQPTKDQLTITGKGKTLLQLSWSNEKEMLRWLKIGKLKENFKVSSQRLKALLEMKFATPAAVAKPKDGKKE